MMAPVGREHGEEAAELIVWLRTFAKSNSLGAVNPEVGFILAPGVVYGPDIAFIEAARLPSRDRRRKFFQGHPTLAVEVVSPDDTYTEIGRKVATYLEYGTARVWVVDADLRTVIVHRPGEDPHTLRVVDVLTSDDAAFGVDGFVLPLSELFSDEE